MSPSKPSASSPEPVAGWEYFDVAADVGVRAWGPDLPACFRQCGLAVFNLMVPLDSVSPAESREILAQADTTEVLLVNWINELLYLHDVEGFVARDLSVEELDDGRVHATLTGEPVDPARHARGIVVKAATFHQLAVQRDTAGVRARVILDV